jgi:hypothetical protein
MWIIWFSGVGNFVTASIDQEKFSAIVNGIWLYSTTLGHPGVHMGYSIPILPLSVESDSKSHHQNERLNATL